MLFQTRSGRSLFYETKTGNSGKTLVLLNGLTQSTAAWSLMTPYFSSHNLLLLDFIFQGKSDKDGEWQSFNEHATDLADLITHLKISRPVLAGLSYGSLVAQHYAVLFPGQLEKLILMSSFCHKTPYYLAIETAWERALQTGGYSLMLDVMLPSVLSESYFNSPIIPIDLMKQARAEMNQDASAIFKLMRATKERKDFRSELKKILVPTLVIHGERDLLFPLHMGEEVANNISGAIFNVIKGAGHTLNLEAGVETAFIINLFLD